MAAPGIGEDFLNGMRGCAESAYITVYDMRDPQSDGTPDTNPAVTSMLLENESNQIAARRAAGGDYVSDAARKRFRVQYNPAELQLFSSVYKRQRADVCDADRTVTEMAEAGFMELNVALRFDKMSVAQSFMMEKNLLPTSASGVTNLVKAAMKEQTVQDEVEGFIAALRSPYTRFVSFDWADFTFMGSLHTVDAQYEMFSISGLPVRARVSLRIKQTGLEGAAKLWKPDLDKAFSGDMSNLVSAEQNVSNLLNLGL